MNGAPRPWLASYDQAVPHVLSYPGMTLQACLEETAVRYPDRAALVFMGKSTSYRTLLVLARRFAASLRQLGISRGDRVVLFLPNSPQFVIAYYGILMAGAVAAPANPLYVERELLRLLKDSGARTIVTLDLKAVFNKVNAVREASGLQNIIVSSLQDYLPFPRNLLFPVVKGKKIARVKGEGIRRMGDLLADRGGAEGSGGVKRSSGRAV